MFQPTAVSLPLTSTRAPGGKVEVDLDYADWSSFKNLDIRDANTGNVISPQPRNWKGSYVVKLGTEYKWLQLSSLPDWIVAVRGGIYKI